MTFEFATADRIIFGPGTADQVGSLAAEMGGKAFLVAGRSPDRYESALRSLADAGVSYDCFRVTGEPTVTSVSEAVRQARDFGGETVIAIGGGSVIDTGKAVAAMLTNPGELTDYLEVVGRGRKLQNRSAPCIAVPTTAGTGAEVTRNSVIAVPEQKVKVSMRSPYMLPAVAIVDPVLTHSMAPSVTASTGLDALCQLLEAYTCRRANPVTDCLCTEGLIRAGRSLRDVFEDGTDTDAREDMSLAALLGGMALANAGLGAVHGLAGPLGGMLAAPHGVLCAAILPHAVKCNIEVIQERYGMADVLARYLKATRLLTGNTQATAEDGISWIERTCKALSIPPLRELGLTEELIPEAVEKATRASSMKGNPVELTAGSLSGILRSAM